MLTRITLAVTSEHSPQDPAGQHPLIERLELTLRSGDPTGADDLRTTVSADDCTHLTQPKRCSGKAGGDKLEEIVDIGRFAVHHGNVRDVSGARHLFVEHLHRPLAGASFPGFGYRAAADVDQRL